MTDDPIEAIIANALTQATIEFVREPDPRCLSLDFYLPEFAIFLECKAFHSPRISAQMSRAPNVIAIQGRAAALAFAALMRRKFLAGQPR